METRVSTVAFVFILTVTACLASTTDSATNETTTVLSTEGDLTTASADSTSTTAAGGSTVSTDSQVTSTVPSTTTVTITECYSHTCVSSDCLSGNLTVAQKCNTTGRCYLSVFRNGTTVTTVEAGCEVGTCSLTQVSTTAPSGETNYTRCCSANLCNVESLISFAQGSASCYLPSLFSVIILLAAQAFVNICDIY